MYLVFGQKTGTHVDYNVMTSNGNLANGGHPHNSGETPQVGGTVMKITTSGEISSMYNYVCKN